MSCSFFYRLYLVVLHTDMIRPAYRSWKRLCFLPQHISQAYSRAVELRHLRYFVAVAEMENVSRAATQKLHVAQPSLSRQIRDLEDEIGVQLLERTAKSVRVTDAGRAFLEEARAILKHTDEAVLKARAVASAEPTELHVGYSLVPTALILPLILRAYQSAMPNVHVRLHDGRVQENLAGLRDGRLQLPFLPRLLKSGDLRGIRLEALTWQRIRLVVSPNHPLAHRRVVSLSDAAREPFVGLTHEEYPEFYEYLSAIFRSVKEKPRIAEEHDRTSGVISSVEAGAGVSIASEEYGYSFGNRVKLLRLTPEPKPIAYCIAARKEKLNLAAEKFWQCARESPWSRSKRPVYPRGGEHVP
jgi:DNA-binding transcriptional LysR family regulator